jgi:hypothetical protein
MVAQIVTKRLGAFAAELPSEPAISRFATAAGNVLAELVDGLSPEGRAAAIMTAALPDERGCSSTLSKYARPQEAAQIEG